MADIKNGSFIKTKSIGVYYRYTQTGKKVFYIRGRLNDRNYIQKIGTKEEGVTISFCTNLRNEKHGVKRLGDSSPMIKDVKYTLNEASELYFTTLENKSDGRNTRARYVRHIQPKLGKHLINEITHEDIEALLTAKRKEVSSKTGRLYSPKTLNDWIHILNAIYNHMNKKLNLKVDNPTANVEKDKVKNNRERYLELHEISALINAIRADTKLRKKDQLLLFTLLALTTGARLTSILTITKSDVMKDTINIRDHKNQSDYIGYIHESVRSLLDIALEDISPMDYIIGRTAQPLSRTSVYKMLQPLLDRLFNTGLKAGDSKRRVVIHTFRHTFATQLVKSNTPIYTVKKLMNHAKIEMTMRYAKHSEVAGKNEVLSLKI